MHGAHAHTLHFAGHLVKFVRKLVLNDKRLCGLGAGDALVKCAGDPGVVLTDLPVIEGQLFL